ncbi:GIY-YIG nuclease family protein [Brevundimonas sp.]|uniref:GIY-YIG nuclease family protein n=1 Tax=Brevundimonas sp. TaxID=1871086 RepID=UPI002D3D2A72|nr:GIY-YIG nuclease family protein [Brevundimonas sp.]HYD27134.1 GIY-YIG nuclease family protein [Brevundimonas sp.]
MRDGPTGFWVYIMANRRNGAIYTGHTDSLGRRVEQHRNGTFGGFTSQYGCKTLVWAEWHETRTGAFRRERRIKEWRRSWKLLLIEERNPTWRDMLEDYLR